MVARCHSGSEDGCRGRRRRRQRKTLLIYIPEFEECRSLSRSPCPSVPSLVPKERLLVIAVLLKICRAANGSVAVVAVSRDYGALDGIMSVLAGRKDLFGYVLSLEELNDNFFANAAAPCMVPLPAILQFGVRIHLHKINQRSIQKQLLQ